MPTYDYKCEDCGYEFEQFQTITAKPIRRCPRCGRDGVKRLIGVGAGIIFKGSGFYETDYRSESYKKAAEKEKSPTSKDTEKNITTAESKKTKDGGKNKLDTDNKAKSV